MSQAKVQGGASGTGSVTLLAPNTSSTQVLTLPDATDTLVAAAAAQTLTNKTWSSPASSTISSGTAVASTSGTSIDFTSIPSWVKRIVVMMNQISTTGTNSPQVQIGSGSVSTSGYLSTSVGGVVGNTVSGNVFSSGFVLYGSSVTAASIQQGHLVLTLFSGNIWTAQGSFAITSGTIGSYTINGTVTLGGTLDRVRITTVGGTDTFDAGSINIQYE
jgi:hypothetical protein